MPPTAAALRRSRRRRLWWRDMGMPVVTVAAGGMPVVDVTPIASMTPIKYGTPVTEAANGKGVAVTKVPKYGMPVIYVVPPL